MMAGLSRALMALAVRSLGDRRSEWGQAMQAEFEAAVEDGKPMGFAIGCLAGAWREMPANDEGRFVIAKHVLAIGLILPVTVMMLSSILIEFGQYGAQDLLPIGSDRAPLLTEANRSAMPSLAIVLLLLGAAHLRVAWSLLECNWPNVIATGALIAALTVTLALFSGVVFVSDTGLIHAAVVGIELVAMLVLARWHAQLPAKAAS
jgi:hypothetical protein